MSESPEKPARPGTDDISPAVHRRLAVEANNSAWDLLDIERDLEHDEELLRRAYAAAYHWTRAEGATVENEARACYLLGKAQLALGQPFLANRYAERYVSLCEDNGIRDFDLAYAYELTARVQLAVGDLRAADTAWAKARAVPIADPDDAAQVAKDFASDR